MQDSSMSGVHLPLGSLHQWQVQRFSAKGTKKPEGIRLAKEVTHQLLVHVLNTLVPQRDSSVTTRMEVETPPIPVPDTRHKIIVVGVVRAGLIVAQPVYEYLIEAGYDCRYDVVMAERQKDDAEHITGVHVDTRKIDGLPKPPAGTTVIIVDPMGATGVTGAALAKYYQELVGETGKVIFLHLIATKQAVEKVHEVAPNAIFVVGRMDPRLTEKGYIEWGAGDVGSLFCEFEAANSDVEIEISSTTPAAA